MWVRFDLTFNCRSLLPMQFKAHKVFDLELTSIPTNKVDKLLFFMVSPPFIGNGEQLVKEIS